MEYEKNYVRLVIGISGASGVIYGLRTLEILHSMKIETHVVLSQWGEKNIEIETDKTIEYVRSLSTALYGNDSLAAPISSGSFLHRGMIIVPCSMKTLASIANGHDDTLISRAAGVTLKESRLLVVVPRETPLSRIHLQNMIKLAEAGAVILPAMPGFYHRPSSLQDMIDHLVGKILDQFNIRNNLSPRWGSLR
ncbi:MAG: UbiX family flavin prenyltransferase [Thermoproteota archaeon]|nr:UbiX family flavin prenyltransferase [Thermoproteota archaeon]